ncbi:major curlin subunit [Kaistia hirudinis]|uniref:Major curlin subunit n=1 Tax=Kaistia hirudinis TaxID=1293440 RepID=A0A840AKR5_9HYPH|nr:curlin [Kaistia hirudinis]MBB3930182.1 major curlin subunit [Kaistia hirudinis]
MTRTLLKTLTIAGLAALIGAAPLATPALAGGSVSFALAPRNAQDAQIMDFGLRGYALYNGIRSGALVRQFGRGNQAGLAQYGAGNVGVVRQQGDGHAATLQQVGNANSYGIFQFGRNTNADVVQQGDSGTGATVQLGW